jgi:hypothetical protein
MHYGRKCPRNQAGRAALVIAGCAVLALTTWAVAADRRPPTEENKVRIGAYYFDGWAGSSRFVTKRMAAEFPEREPIWGWRDDSLDVMERQIGIAAEHGVAFFAFCWYWHDNGQAINQNAIKADPKHTGLELFLKARNNHRMKFCLLVANHQGFEIKGVESWKQAADFWMPYLKHPQYLTVDGKPLLIIFSPEGGDQAGFAYLQEAARKAGLPGVAIAGCGGGAAQMGYTHRTHYNVIPGYTAGSQEHKYAELAEAHARAWGGTREQPYLPAVSAGWDARPWEPPQGLGKKPGWYFPDRTPEQFAASLRDAIEWMDRHPDQTIAERTILVYAWNEFGEGGYIAPTKGDPEGRYLEALQSVLASANTPRR